jgi:hypothetical protein
MAIRRPTPLDRRDDGGLGQHRSVGTASQPIDARRTSCVRGSTTPSWTDVSGPQREHPRYAHEAVIALHTPDQAISGRTRNLSRGGLCAVLPEQIAVGTTVALDIQLVFGRNSQSEPLRLPALVVWCTSFEDRYQVGLRFLAVDNETAEYLAIFLRYLDEGALARGAAPGSSTKRA